MQRAGWDCSIAEVPTPSDVPADGAIKPTRRGRLAIKRAAVVPASRCVGGPSGNDSINEANLPVAVGFGN
jgi:hypothetical protein